MDQVDNILRQWRTEKPELDVAPMGTIGRIRRLSAHLGREMQKTFEAHGLNPAGFDVLATLRRSGSPYALSPGDLLKSTMVTSGTMTNRIDQLEKAGLVERIRNPDDGRSVLIGLTTAGKALIDTAVADHVSTQHTLVAGMSSENLAQLDGLLRKFLAFFESSARRDAG